MSVMLSLFHQKLCYYFSQVLALRPTTCVIVGESLSHTGLPRELNNGVYVEMLCDLVAKELFHLMGSLSKRILNAKTHKISWDKVFEIQTIPLKCSW